MDDRLRKFFKSQDNISNIISRTNLTDRIINNDPFKEGGDRIRELQEKIHEQKMREKQEELEYREAVLKALQGIERNTAFLSEVSLLLQKNNERQDEIFQLLVEILEIMKSRTIEEAESKYRQVMRKIGEFAGDIGTIQTLYGIGQAVFNAFQSLHG
jgi:flagellar motor component MotA